ncbi:MAG: acyl-CoA desaturase [Thermoplasmatota archaeon]
MDHKVVDSVLTEGPSSADPLARERPSLLRQALLLTAVILPLVATAYAMILLWNRLVNLWDVEILVGMYIATGLGITIGYHRMLTHRSFEAPSWVRAIFLILGSMALEGPAVEWSATHLKHHAKADAPGDPHSPLEGFFHAHVGWLFEGTLISSGMWTRPFEGDRVAQFVNRTFWVWAILGLVIPYELGGWQGLLWGGGVRIFLLHHATWSVNSVCHSFGRRPFATKDASRNEWVVGLLGFGEGWHNNHHAAPSSAYHGFRWWQFDLSAYVIRTLAAVGLVSRVVRPPTAGLAARQHAAPPSAATTARPEIAAISSLSRP